MKKGQIIEGIVQRVDFPNKGIVETEDGICVVKNALPGQRVQCAVNKVRKGKAEGRFFFAGMRQSLSAFRKLRRLYLSLIAI